MANEKKSGPIRIVVVDDHSIVREGLRLILSVDPTMQVVGQAADGQEALDTVQKVNPDILLLDVDMPRMNGLEALKTLSEGDSDVKSVLLTASIENRFALAEQIRAARPKTVILPYWEGRHPDHYTAATLGYEACYAAGLKQLPVSGQPHRPNKVLYASMYWEVKPSFLVDITTQWERKLAAINCFASQFAGDLRDITELYPAWGKLID